MWAAKGSPEHALGTDPVGRDVLSRLIHGGGSPRHRRAAVLIAGRDRCGLGLIGGYYGGTLDSVITTR